ncbi:MAG: hypothetical protein PVG63_06535 [Anaerolineales bacterium]|jgi:hypothetical protein
MTTIKSLQERVPIPLRIAALVILVLLFVLILGLVLRGRAQNGYPLVQIHSPWDGETIALSELATVQASATSPQGMERLELWVDGEFVDAVESDPSDDLALLALNVGWEATTVGEHVIVVRAYSAGGVESQATVFVEAVEGEGRMTTHMLGEGETLEEVAADHGLSVDELVAMNPGLDADAVQDGDFVNVPSGSGPRAGGEGGMPPEAEANVGQPPWYIGQPVDHSLLNIPSLSDYPDGNLLLRLEALGLQTGAAYESLHCYASIGGRSPRWYPDVDGDQVTPEYFDSVDGVSWDVAAHMADQNAPGIYWPENETLSFTMTCVGIQGGGTQAVELGPMSLSIPPEMWDGVIRTATTESGEGSFSLDYRVTPGELVAKGPNSEMARPINLWINYGGGYLNWDYQPDEGDEEPIDGFMVFLNDTLVWQEEADARRAMLPDPWLMPPCGTEYEFTVVAFVAPYPFGDHSVPREVWDEDYQDDRVSISGGEPGSTDCAQRFVLTFTSLSTGTIPEDSYDWPANNWDHGSGPIHGNFYTRDQNAFFEFWRFVPNVEYSADQLYSGGGISPSFIFSTREMDVEEHPGQYWFGFRITDEDEDGYQLLCHGSEIVSIDWFAEAGFHEGEILSEEDSGHRCQATYVLHPADGSSVGTGGDDLALPQLRIEGFSVDPGSDQLRVHVRNVGLAAWQNRDLEVAITTRDGEVLDTITWEDFNLPVGEEAMLQSTRLTPHPPFGVCLTLDPNDHVLELYEHTGVSRRNFACPPLPDFSIGEVRFDPAGERFLVTIVNVGEQRPIGDGVQDDRNLGFRIEFADGTFNEFWRTDVRLGRVDEVTIPFYLPSDEVDRLRDGYTIIVDPHNEFAELNEDNNEYHGP